MHRLFASPACLFIVVLVSTMRGGGDGLNVTDFDQRRRHSAGLLLGDVTPAHGARHGAARTVARVAVQQV